MALVADIIRNDIRDFCDVCRSGQLSNFILYSAWVRKTLVTVDQYTITIYIYDGIHMKMWIFAYELNTQ